MCRDAVYLDVTVIWFVHLMSTLSPDLLVNMHTYDWDDAIRRNFVHKTYFNCNYSRDNVTRSFCSGIFIKLLQKKQIEIHIVRVQGKYLNLFQNSIFLVAKGFESQLAME